MLVFKSVRFKNFLSFGNVWQEVNLMNARKTIILGTNGQGKSALIDVITFALYGKPFRKINKGLLINSINKKDLLVELFFEIKGINYKLIRGIAPGVFEIYVDGVLLPQDASSRDYQNILEMDILKFNYRTFTQIVILGSGSYVQFMKLSTSAKREIIEDILDISVFSKMNELLKPMIKEGENNIQLLEGKKDMNKSHYTFMFEKSLKNKDSKEKRRLQKIEEIERLEIERLEKLELVNETAVKKIAVEPIDPPKARKNKLSEFGIGIKKNLSLVDTEIEFYTQNDTCPKCKKVLDDEFKEERISFLAGKKKEFDQALEQLNIGLNAANDKIKEIQSLNKKNDAIIMAVQTIESELSSINYKINYLRKDIESINNEDDEIISADELEELKNLVKESDRLLQQQYHDIHIMKLGISILKDSGAKTSIIKFYLPLINKTINYFLERFDFNVLFMFDENFDESIRARHIDTFKYGSFSEGEKKRIDLALMFTWREIARKKNSASTNLLFFDEVLDSGLDLKGLDDFMLLLNELSSETNVFVISHNEDLTTSSFDSVIFAEKVSNFSSYKS